MYSLRAFVNKTNAREILKLLADQPLSASAAFHHLKVRKIPCSIESVQKELDSLYQDRIVTKIDNDYTINPEWLNWFKKWTRQTSAKINQNADY